MLKALNIYQIISLIASLAFFVPSLIRAIDDNMGIGLAVISFVLISFIFFILYTNVKLLRGEKNLKYLKINKYFNYAQIFHLTILKFVYYFIAGPLIMPYILSDTSLGGAVNIAMFNIRFKLYFEDSDQIMLGINLVPIFAIIILEKAIRSYNIK
jgi:hypothetical protein